MAIGWEKLRERVLADYTPERVAKICRVPAETIERLVKRWESAEATEGIAALQQNRKPSWAL